MSVFDLNWVVDSGSASAHKEQKGGAYAYRTDRFLTAHGFLANPRIAQMCRAVSRQPSDPSFSCLDQFLCMTFAQLTNRMKEFTEITNANEIPYGGPTDNSNSYAFTFVESLGFTRSEPTVWAPGWDAGRPSRELSYWP